MSKFKFKFNPDAKYRTGGVYNPTHQFSLVHQVITIKQDKSFDVRFPDIWKSYKLPLVKKPETYDNWIASPMQFWQNQLNFAIWCATTGCGVSKLDHLKHKNSMIRSVFRFHAYYQIRRILSEMKCPIPTEESFNPFSNGIDMSAFERICNEFNIPLNADFRQRLDYSHGMGSYYFYKKFYHYRFIGSKKWTVFTNGGDYDPSMNWKITIHAERFKGADEQTDSIEYIKQTFSKQKAVPAAAKDDPKDGNKYDAIGSFICDQGNGFTQAGITRINDSIRTYVWAVLGAQSQTRSSILGTEAYEEGFDAQKQFLANIEDAIYSEVDLPSSIARYQMMLQYARSKLDFVIGHGLYMIPSDMDLYIGTINGYNNLITIATDDLQLGLNNNINEDRQLQEHQFESPKDDFELPLQTAADSLQTDDLDLNDQLQPVQTAVQTTLQTEVQKEPPKEEFTHEDNKLLLTLSGIFLGSIILWWR